MPLITTPQELRGAFSLRLGHRAGLTRHWRLIQYRADTSLPTKGEAIIKVASPDLKFRAAGTREYGVFDRLKPTSSAQFANWWSFPIVGKPLAEAFALVFLR